LGITIFSTNFNAALPLEKAAEQQNICSQELGGNHKAAEQRNIRIEKF